MVQLPKLFKFEITSIQLKSWFMIMKSLYPHNFPSNRVAASSAASFRTTPSGFDIRVESGTAPGLLVELVTVEDHLLSALGVQNYANCNRIYQS